MASPVAPPICSTPSRRPVSCSPHAVSTAPICSTCFSLPVRSATTAPPHWPELFETVGRSPARWLTCRIIPDGSSTPHAMRLVRIGALLKKRMGDYVTGYVSSPRLPIDHAVAASAAVPGLLGSLRLDTRRFEWFAYDRGSKPRPHAPRFRTLTSGMGGLRQSWCGSAFQARWWL